MKDENPYFTNAEVNDMLSDLEKDNGFWSRTSAELNTMADKIDQVSLTPNKIFINHKSI